MRHLFFCIMFCMVATTINAQNINQQQVELPLQDSVKVEIPPLADSSLVGKSVMQFISETSGNVQVNQPAAMEEAYKKYVKANGERKRNGYRIRLFFDNKQTARMESEELEISFKEQFPLIPVYRSYSNPFFKVVVGDYRTKSDAMKELGKILPFYPQAIVVKESIYYPVI